MNNLPDFIKNASLKMGLFTLPRQKSFLIASAPTFFHKSDFARPEINVLRALGMRQTE